MLKGFEKITHNLSDQELKNMIPKLIGWFELNHDTWISSSKIKAKFKSSNIKTSGPRIRAMINHIRKNNEFYGVLIASSKGYKVTRNKKEIYDYINSLNQRINEITSIKNSIKNKADSIGSLSLFSGYSTAHAK